VRNRLNETTIFWSNSSYQIKNYDIREFFLRGNRNSVGEWKWKSILLGTGLGMGMGPREWKGIGIQKPFPQTSTLLPNSTRGTLPLNRAEDLRRSDSLTIAFRPTFESWLHYCNHYHHHLHHSGRVWPAARWWASGWGIRQDGRNDTASRTCELRVARPRSPRTPSRFRCDDVSTLTQTSSPLWSIVSVRNCDLHRS